MQLVKTYRLSGRQKEEVELLLMECRSFRPIHLSFPFEDGSVFYLAYEVPPSGAGLIPVCALALIMPGMTGSETAECVAFTHPGFRKNGYFSTLFEAAQEEIADLDLLFPVDGQDEAALPVLESLCAQFDYCEYKMELSLSSSGPCADVTFENRLNCSTENGSDDSCLYSFFLPEYKTGPVAVCRTASFDSKICLYGFEVEKGFRGRGIGEEALLALIKRLRGRADSLILHVNGENEAAVNLYKKTGFRVTETLSYYLY